jgi:hypothetical protein
MKTYIVIYEINGERKEFHIEALDEMYAMDACYEHNAYGEDGEETYKVITVYEDSEEDY